MPKIILNFHGIGPIIRKIEDGEKNCWLELDSFRHILNLIQFQPNIELTFDDGNISDADVVLPELLSRGLRAQFFICSGRIGKPGFLDRAHIHSLIRSQMSVGSHGINHVSWRSLNAEDLRNELTISRKSLEEISGTPILSAACPFGDYDRRVLRCLRDNGFDKVYTSDGGISRSSFLQPRNTINRNTPIEGVRQMIESGFSTIKQLGTDIRISVKRLRF